MPFVEVDIRLADGACARAGTVTYTIFSKKFPRHGAQRARGVRAGVRYTKLPDM